VRASLLALWQGAVRLYWDKWSEDDWATGPSTLGLVNADTYQTPKPALLALAHMAHLLAGAELPPQRVKLRPGQWCLRFDCPDAEVNAVWDPNGPSKLAWPRGDRAWDIYGNPVARREWSAGPDPLWLVGQGDD